MWHGTVQYPPHDDDDGWGETGCGMMNLVVPLWPYDRWSSVSAMVEAVQLVDQLGLHGVALGDHTVVPAGPAGDGTGRYWPDPIVLATHCAAVTAQVRLVFHVLVLAQRHPIITAKQVATIDALAPQRVSLGVGTGWLTEEFAALGADFPRRAHITEEHLHAMEELWYAAEPAYRGEFVSFANIVFEPRPTTRLPVLIAGRGRRVLQQVARSRAGWLPMTSSVEDLLEAIDTLRSECTASGRDPGTVEIMAGVRFDSTMSAAATSAARDTLAHRSAAGVTHAVAWFDWSSDQQFRQIVEWLANDVSART